MRMQFLRKVASWLRTLRPLLPQRLINYAWHLPKACIATWVYGNPAQDLSIIGVTGTDGKTTTTLLIYHLLKTARKRVAVVSTVEASVGTTRLDTGFHVTAPDPFPLQRFLKKVRAQKMRYVVLEATSHGLDQFRLFPLRPKIAVLTNITHEHLDYHKTFGAYQAAKLKLFAAAKHAVMNKDLPQFASLNRALPHVLLSTYSIDSRSQLTPSHIKYLRSRTKFTVGRLEYELPLPGKYNLYNALAAMSVALIEGVSPADIKRGLMTFPGVPGRFERIANGLGINALVDFAHTPAALSELLTTIHEQKRPQAKVILVFGAASKRDTTKRPLMGKVAAQLADQVVLTAEDPRGEDVASICQQILSQATPKSKFKVVPDRRQAIQYAVGRAKRGDWVVLAGKGHEQSMNLDGWTELPWSDQQQLREAMQG